VGHAANEAHVQINSHSPDFDSQTMIVRTA